MDCRNQRRSGREENNPHPPSGGWQRPLPVAALVAMKSHGDQRTYAFEDIVGGEDGKSGRI